jgi:hypothetical protein
LEALIAFGGVVLGWLLGAGTQIVRDRRQAAIALALVQNELLGNVAQLELALEWGVEEEGVRPTSWLKRWKLSRMAWEQHGPAAMTLLDAADAWKVHQAYHALDAAELLFDEAREAVAELKQVDLVASENAARVREIAALDAEARKKLELQIRALWDAAEVVDRPLRRRSASLTQQRVAHESRAGEAAQPPPEEEAGASSPNSPN